ncbi:MAG: hypothetical protein RJA72_121 [Pseudomonadota bacterium]|jgi:hypothetical protein
MLEQAPSKLSKAPRDVILRLKPRLDANRAGASWALLVRCSQVLRVIDRSIDGTVVAPWLLKRFSFECYGICAAENTHG